MPGSKAEIPIKINSRVNLGCYKLNSCNGILVKSSVQSNEKVGKTVRYLGKKSQIKAEISVEFNTRVITGC